MPQMFQVLKCYKCSVFQVHQTKKSNKWECKLCGEKQSIKRHYGLGTGKECRLHVQKLNSIRGKVDEINETCKQNDTSDEEVLVQDKTEVPGIKQPKLKRKWSEFVDETKESQVPEPNESMYLGNAEVVLEVPAKRRKLTKPTKNAPDSNTYPTKTDDFNRLCKVRKSPSPPLIALYETQKPKVQNNLPKTKVFKSNDAKKHGIAKQKQIVVIKPFENSKWEQFADESDRENYYDDLSPPLSNDKIISVTDYTSNKDAELEKFKDVKEKKILNNMPKSIFSLCNENDLDDVLDF